MLRPEAARRQGIQLRPADLAQALIALPTAAWRYGRVIAVAESPLASKKDRPRSAATWKPSFSSSTTSEWL